MKRSVYTLGLGSLFAGLLWWSSASAGLAMTADLVSITPDATDITDQITANGGDAPAGVAMFGWVGTVDQDYTAVFSVDESPLMAVTLGADMSTENPWSYDAETGLVTVDFTLKGIVGSDSFMQMPDGMGMGMIALVPVTADGEDGAPAEMAGGWFATNLQQWSIIPPTQDNPAFGFDLTGSSGTVGYFHMFMPSALIDLLGQLSGKELTVDDLAVFNGDYQSSMSVTEVNGGAYIDINVTFNDASTTVASTTNVTKSITAAPRLPISLSPSKTSLSKGSNEKLYGWINHNQANKTVNIYRKLKGEDSFTLWKTVTTNSSGYYKTTYTANKTATYKAKYKTNQSAKVKVTVE